MQPTAHMSTPTPYILAPKSSSGERYHLKQDFNVIDVILFSFTGSIDIYTAFMWKYL